MVYETFKDLVKNWHARGLEMSVEIMGTKRASVVLAGKKYREPTTFIMLTLKHKEKAKFEAWLTQALEELK
ncbi:hypothetical protein vBYenM531-1_13 [Yersinia phage vB_YenM_531]|nr:hypothetical protein X1_44 [Yersinia phage vB_Yen_X1]QKN86992.1 hypothetical protein vBYenM531-1_13 [Yersinia phage vB_YenM_531]QKN87084.1 hypothetical protein vBYenM534_13 [Yersinia phage vB_YenM_534]QKN87448.1 hypothetical protein vBYenM281_013 [Yersinia phage vB_YenM_281]CAJ28411.1 hypothetical protein [Yersinia phage PY100]